MFMKMSENLKIVMKFLKFRKYYLGKFSEIGSLGRTYPIFFKVNRFYSFSA